MMRCEQRVLQLKVKVHPSLFTESVGPQNCFGGFWLFFNHFDRRTENRAKAAHPLLYQEAERRIHPDRKWIGKLTEEIGEEAARKEFTSFEWNCKNSDTYRLLFSHESRGSGP
ncbi:MAG: hypothetical protein SVO96_01255 [Pseudomonadota bacterium]|nr:hypothetical protein [Pseudomonadota bacterium]